MSKKKVGSGLIAQLQEAIKGSGLSLYAICKDAGVSQAQLSRFMRGERTLTLPAAEKICRVLHLDLTKTEEPPSEEEPPAKKPKKGRGE